MEHLGPAISGGSRTTGTAGASACRPHVWVWGTQAMVARKVQGLAPRAGRTELPTGDHVCSSHPQKSPSGAWLSLQDRFCSSPGSCVSTSTGQKTRTRRKHTCSHTQTYTNRGSHTGTHVCPPTHINTVRTRVNRHGCGQTACCGRQTASTRGHPKPRS